MNEMTVDDWYVNLRNAIRCGCKFCGRINKDATYCKKECKVSRMLASAKRIVKDAVGPVYFHDLQKRIEQEENGTKMVVDADMPKLHALLDKIEALYERYNSTDKSEKQTLDKITDEAVDIVSCIEYRNDFNIEPKDEEDGEAQIRFDCASIGYNDFILRCPARLQVNKQSPGDDYWYPCVNTGNEHVYIGKEGFPGIIIDLDNVPSIAWFIKQVEAC